MRRKINNISQRQQLAAICARLIVQSGIKDFHSAKRKAAAELGVTNTANLPSNAEIEAELIIYQNLFQSSQQSQHIKHLRQVALKAMQLFVDFNPRLVGSVLSGSATQHSNIILHLFAHTTEDIDLFLLQHGIPYQLSEKRFKMEQNPIFPCYQFMAGNEKVSLIIFGIDDIRWSPPSPIDGKPMPRADIKAVNKLLADE
jgi:hypothetical protein